MTDTVAKISPAATALLMMDYQNGILGILGHADDLLSRWLVSARCSYSFRGAAHRDMFSSTRIEST